MRNKIILLYNQYIWFGKADYKHSTKVLKNIYILSYHIENYKFTNFVNLPLIMIMIMVIITTFVAIKDKRYVE
ncbi:hypothetical protein A6A11_02760 [Bisgaardia hudsonensis]|nr:hypothetical protein A6A11_02760 [Bisgaardia hudsonensis]